MHDLAFADYTRPTRVACLRLPLLPYSLGHELILSQQRNPLAICTRATFDALPEDDQIQSLIRAVSVCSRSWSGNHKPEKWLWLWWWMIQKTDWPVAIADFRNYLEAGRSTLPVINADDPESKEAFEIALGIQKMDPGGRALGSPFLAQMILFAVKHLRVELEAAYDLP